MESNKYQLDDYMQLLQESFNGKCQVDYTVNKLGQPSIRIQYKIDRLKSFDMFIFENGFVVAYKPTGRSKCYEHLTPKQAICIVKMSISKYICS